MKKAYIAGPLFDDHEREYLVKIANLVESYGFNTFLPCLLYTSPSPRDKRQSRMPSSA